MSQLATFTNPVLTLDELANLPVFSIISANGILFEKSVTEKGERATFVELGVYGTSCQGEFTANFSYFEDTADEGDILLLKVGSNGDNPKNTPTP